MKILVTGGAGYIGSHTVVELINAGYEPIIVDNFSNSFPEVIPNIEKILDRKVTWYKTDCNDKQALAEIFGKEEDIKGAIHFAAFKAVGESVAEPLKYYRNNLLSLVTLLEVMKEFDAPHFVFSSSCTVYGEPDAIPVTETSPIKPGESPYGKTKQMCEDIINDTTNSTNLHAAILRYFNPIGAHPSKLIGELPIGKPANLVPFITQVAAGKYEKVTVFGDDYDTEDGTCVRDYIHVVDLAKAHVKALDLLQKDDNNFTFNLGTGKGVSVLQAINAFMSATGVDLPYEIGGRRDGDVVAVYSSTDYANETLGWQAELSLEEAMKSAWDWQQNVSNLGFKI